MKILVYYPFTDEQIEAIRALAGRRGGHVVYSAQTEQEAVRYAPEVEVILGAFPPAVCAAAPKLRWIQTFSAGMDKFLYPAIVERDEVEISNVAGLYASQCAEHAWALLLALTRRLSPAVHRMDAHMWAGEPVIEVTGMTLGVIGMGGIGVEMVKRAQGYAMTILATDAVRTEAPAGVVELKPSTRENLHNLMRRADVVMTACPLIPETYHLIGRAELAIMKPSAYLINVTRGGIVDEDALVEALAAGQIAGAGLDVVEHEPLTAESPLWDAPNLILTPHQAGASQHRPRKIHEFFMANLERYLTGVRPINLIDKRRGF